MKWLKSKRMTTWGAVAVVVVGLLVLALIPEPVPVDLVTVARGPLEVTVDHEGKTRVRERYEVSAPVVGQVLRIELEPGDPVVAGETLLATFEPGDPQPLDKRTRAGATARVQAARASLDAATAERQRAGAAAEFADIQVARSRKLAEDGIISSEVLDGAEVEARSQADALAAAQAAERAARHEVEAAEAALISVRSSSVNETKNPGPELSLYSPVSGLVLRRLRESSAVVAAGEPLVEVADIEDLEVVADYLSEDAVKIRPGMRVEIDQWGGDEVLNGRVKVVEPSGFMKISALGVEEQRVNVIVAFDDPYEAWRFLGDAYRVELRVVIWENDDVLKVPTASLFRSGGGWAVFVVEGGRARLREVTVGERSGLEAEVLGGLGDGEVVVVHPSDALSDGARVRQRANG